LSLNPSVLSAIPNKSAFIKDDFDPLELNKLPIVESVSGGDSATMACLILNGENVLVVLSIPASASA